MENIHTHGHAHETPSTRIGTPHHLHHADIIIANRTTPYHNETQSRSTPHSGRNTPHASLHELSRDPSTGRITPGRELSHRGSQLSFEAYDYTPQYAQIIPRHHSQCNSSQQAQVQHHHQQQQQMSMSNSMPMSSSGMLRASSTSLHNLTPSVHDSCTQVYESGAEQGGPPHQRHMRGGWCNASTSSRRSGGDDRGREVGENAITPTGSRREITSDSPYHHVTCPVHSPFRYRYANGGPDYYDQHQVIFIYN